MPDPENLPKPEQRIPTKRPRSGPALNVFLFAATLASTWMVGATGETVAEQVANGLVYMASVIGILLSHEMGHYFMARRNKVDASLPFFIPFPLSLFGTLGAVIVMRGRIRSRNALMEVGAAGPLAGMIVALPVLLVGLSLSKVGPMLSSGGILEGQSLLYLLLKRIAVGPIPDGYDVYLHPMAWAGWIGLLVTMLNLLPIGQLDGGHISYALFGQLHGKISRLFILGIFLLGFGVLGYGMWTSLQRGYTGEALSMYLMSHGNWFFLGGLLFFFFGRGRRRNHPPTDDNSLSPGHRAVGIVCIVLFIVTFTPIPLTFLP